MRTIIFDLDGTLYEDETIFDVYATKLSGFVPPARRTQFVADWEAAKAGRGVAAIGLGYEESTDRLFRFDGNRIINYIDWDGSVIPILEEHLAKLESGAVPTGAAMDGPSLFGVDRFNIGDMWWLPAALAAHYGVGPDQRQQAFLATRDFMSSGNYRITPIAGVSDLLARLRASGRTLIAMTNSPPETTRDVLAQLGLTNAFAQVQPLADKPAGLTRFLHSASLPRPILSVGDNYVNDIEPTLEAGASALYIDRYDLSLGEGQPRCARVHSAAAMVAWLEREAG